MSATRTVVRHHLGAVDEFPFNQFRTFEISGRPVGVVRTSQGFFAVRNRCPHQAANICAGRVAGTMVASKPFEYDYSEETLVVTCPWHRWEFELGSGASFGRVTNKRLVTYPIEIDSGQVYITMKGGRQ
jgi:3-phenylpropionate/trans-cinnamate dioxygenase ferredoxin subunit